MNLSLRDLALTRAERAELSRPSHPRALQAYIDTLPVNFEPDGDTCFTVRQVLRYRRAHCIEGALVAACSLWLHGEPPLVMDFRAHRDYDHVVALYRRGGYWGAISKSNHLALRGRDPVFRTLRELALSYFHEYHNEKGERTLREYSRAFDLRTLALEHWATGEEGAWEAERRIDLTRHYRLFPASQSRHLSPIDAMEWQAKALLQYPRPKKGRG